MSVPAWHMEKDYTVLNATVLRPSALLPLGGSSLQDGHFEGRIGGRLFLQPHTTAEYLSGLHGCVQFSQRVDVCQNPLHVHICQTISRHTRAVYVSTCHEICDTCTKVFKGCQRVTPCDRDTLSNAIRRARACVRCVQDFTTRVRYILVCKSSVGVPA